MRVLLVVNPSASRVTSRREHHVVDSLAADHDVAVVHTESRGHATELVDKHVAAATAAGDAVDAVVVLAGDGTLNEVVAALAGSEIPLAALPGGSTNVFCRTVGVPDDLRHAVRVLRAALSAGTSRRVGLGSVNGRYFLLHAGIGWDAELVAVVERHSALKRRLGHLLFAYAGLRTFFGGYDRSYPHFAIRFGDEVVADGCFALVMNSDPYTFVHTRPFRVDPTNDFSTPLTVAVTRSMRTDRFVAVAFAALRGRGLRSGPWLEVRRGVESLSIGRLRRSPLPAMPYQVDGDHLGDAEELHVRHHPDALTILVPGKLSGAAPWRGRARS